MIKRSRGSKGIKILECINPKYQKYRLRWDIQIDYNEDGEEQGVDFFEYEFMHKPTIQEIKEVILNSMNSIIDEKIVSGYTWKNMPIWLSTENQFNYKAAFDLAVTYGSNLPVTFKFGTTEEPVYYTFESVEDLADFYTGAMKYINTQLNQGWQEKDNFDWSPYIEAL